MEACRSELTLTTKDVSEDRVALVEENGRLLGLAQVSFDAEICFLEKMFVDPRDMGRGIGRILFEWCVATAQGFGTKEMIVEADPQAATFYRRMGCNPAGNAESGSIPGRMLPRLKLDIDSYQPQS